MEVNNDQIANENCGEGEGNEQEEEKPLFEEGGEKDEFNTDLDCNCQEFWKSEDYTTCYKLERSSESSKRKEKDPDKMSCPVEKVLATVTNYNSIPQRINQTINYEKFNSLQIYDHYVENVQNPESAFYILTDSWKDQVITLTLTVTLPPSSKNGKLRNERKGAKPSKAMITVDVQPWDWRNDLCIESPIISLETRKQCEASFKVTKGRNTLRLFVDQDYPDITGGSKLTCEVTDEDRNWMEKDRKENVIPFTVTICCNFPFMIGTKEKILLYMTNPPVTLLKQTQMICNSLWLLILGAWKSKEYAFRGLKCLRKSYCPSLNKTLFPNKDNKGSHELFEELFYVVVANMSGDLFNHWLVLTLRALFLNPRLGIGIFPYKPVILNRSGCSKYDLEALTRCELPKNIYSAILTIQKYFRGWQTRQVIKPGRLSGKINFWTKSHQKIEMSLKVLAHLFENSTDESFLNIKQLDLYEEGFGGGETVKNSIPNPPKWAFYLFSKLLEGHPWLYTVHEFEFCTPLHLEIQELKGCVISGAKIGEIPFFKQIFLIPKGIRTFYVHIELTAKGMKELKMKIFNNDTFEIVKLAANTKTLFVGRLSTNCFGYTIHCFKNNSDLPNSSEDDVMNMYEEWNLKFIHAAIQPGPIFVHDLKPHLLI